MTPTALKTWRLDNKLTQRQLAALIGVHWAKISYWEHGTRRMDGPTRLILRLLQDPAVLTLALAKEKAHVSAPESP